MFNFACQVWAARSIDISVGKYSDNTPCDEVLEMYDIKDLEHFAADEFLYFYHDEHTLRQGKIQSTL